MTDIAPMSICPQWIVYPELYIQLSRGEITDFLPWYLIRYELSFIRMENLRKLYKRELYPFARRDYTDDLACWEKNEGNKVFIIQDYLFPGIEQREIFDNFDGWYKWALQQS